MKVLQILGGYHKQSLYKELFDRLSSMGVESEVYSHCEPGETVSQKFPANIHIYNHFSQIDRITFFGKQRKIIRDLYRDFTISQSDLIHAHTLFSSGYAAYTIARKIHIPYIVAVRSVDINVFLKRMPFLVPLGLKIMLDAQKVIFLSRVFQKETIEKFPTKYHSILYEKSLVIPNGIDDVFHNNLYISRQRPSDEMIKLIMVAGFNENKNLDGVIKACDILIKNGKTVWLSLVGEIRDDKSKQLVESRNYIEYHDKCGLDQVIDYLRCSHVFVMPSHTESFGLVYAEAMSQGLPVIYTKGQGFDGQFDDATVGYAVSDKDSKELADCILKAYENYDTLSSNCLSLVSKFNWKTISEQYRDIYVACSPKK
jgi:glycosyltransferase involved in cell wall biosynthesis